MLLDINGLGLATATEFLDTTNFLYLADLCQLGRHGRAPPNPRARQLASQHCPRGFKNGTDGNIRVAIDAIQASTASHLFTAPGSQGGMVVIRAGNPVCHIILRGGTLPNYHQSDVMDAAERLARQGAQPSSDGGLQPRQQPETAQEPAQGRRRALPSTGRGSDAVAAVMVERFLREAMKPAPLGELQYGLSVTDACLCWEESETLLAMLAGRCRPAAIVAKRLNSPRSIIKTARPLPGSPLVYSPWHSRSQPMSFIQKMRDITIRDGGVKMGHEWRKKIIAGQYQALPYSA